MCIYGAYTGLTTTKQLRKIRNTTCHKRKMKSFWEILKINAKMFILINKQIEISV